MQEHQDNERPRTLRVLLAAQSRVRGGGQEKNFIEVARKLQVSYRFSFLFAGGYIEDDMPAIGPVYSFPGRARWLLAPIDLLYMAHVVKKEKIHIVHAHHRYPAFLASLLRKILGFRQVTTAHNVFPDKSGFSRWGDHVIAVSHGVEHWLTNECGVEPSIITVIHNGIEPPETSDMQELDRLRTALDIDPDVPVLCTVGRLLPQKNYQSLLQALARIQDRPWHLLVIGEGEQLQMLQALGRELGIDRRTSFLGFREDVQQLMQLSTAYVMSSLWEGLPYVLVESLANGLPMVATNVGGVSEVVLDGVTGLLAEPGDDESLAGQIGKILDNPDERDRMSAEARRHFARHFHIDSMLEALENVYLSLAG